MNYIIIDQGTSSTKAFLINTNGRILYSNKAKYDLQRPRPFHIECDPETILNDIKRLFYEMTSLSIEEKINGVGIAFQRSTFLFWEKSTCKPVTPAISWQDSRADKVVTRYKKYEKELWNITGTPLSAHFGGPKFIHMVENDKTLNNRVKNDDLFFGPLSAFITHAITGTPSIDESIAGRTLMYNLKRGDWSRFATNLFNVPNNCLPAITPVKYDYGRIFDSKIRLLTVIGDQQAALIGQNGIKEDTIGTNFGTSASIQYSAGPKPINIKGLISSVLYSDEKSKAFMVEGTINACNALFYHLESVLSIPHKNMRWDERIKNITTTGIFVPGFNGISAPYWKTGFDDIYVDLDSDPDQIIRAGMESIGYLMNDILDCLYSAGVKIPKTLTASGGAARPVLLQFISSLTKIKIGYYDIKDRTAIGVYKILSGQYSIKFKKDKNLKRFVPKNLPHEMSKKTKWDKTLVDAKIKNNYSDI